MSTGNRLQRSLTDVRRKYSTTMVREYVSPHSTPPKSNARGTVSTIKAKYAMEKSDLTKFVSFRMARGESGSRMVMGEG